MEDKKKRTANFTSDEKRILAELVLKYQDVVENKRTDASTNAIKMKGWIRLAEEFNNISTYCNRTHNVLKCCWENIKRHAKKNHASRKKNLCVTVISGDGKQPSPPPSSGNSDIVEAMALEINPHILYDSDTGAKINESVKEYNSPVKDPLTIADTINLSKQNVDDTGSDTSEENNRIDSWSSWTPDNLQIPILGSSRRAKKNEDWLKRKRTNSDSSADQLYKEKTKLIRILQQNALKESHIRLAILKEQLKQEKIKTQKLESTVK